MYSPMFIRCVLPLLLSLKSTANSLIYQILHSESTQPCYTLILPTPISNIHVCMFYSPCLHSGNVQQLAGGHRAAKEALLIRCQCTAQQFSYFCSTAAWCTCICMCTYTVYVSKCVQSQHVHIYIHSSALHSMCSQHSNIISSSSPYTCVHNWNMSWCSYCIEWEWRQWVDSPILASGRYQWTPPYHQQHKGSLLHGHAGHLEPVVDWTTHVPNIPPFSRYLLNASSLVWTRCKWQYWFIDGLGHLHDRRRIEPVPAGKQSGWERQGRELCN